MWINIILGLIVLGGLGMFCYGVEKIEKSHRDRLNGDV